MQVQILNWKPGADFGDIKEMNALREDAERQFKGLLRAEKSLNRARKRVVEPMTEDEKKAIAADCRFNAFFGPPQRQSKVCQTGDCLHASFLSNAEKKEARSKQDVETAKAAVEKSTTALQVSIKAVKDAAGAENVRVYDVPRRPRRLYETVMGMVQTEDAPRVDPDAPSLEERAGEIVDAIAAANPELFGEESTTDPEPEPLYDAPEAALAVAAD